MIRINQLKLKINHTEEDLKKEIRRAAKGQNPLSYKIVKKSIDARKKPDLYYIYTVDATFADEKRLLGLKKSPWAVAKEVTYRFPYKNDRPYKAEDENRPVIIGAGPAGLFAGLVLARAGFAPLIYERGEQVEDRTRTVEHFFNTCELNEESNVQFGEGGAGTFSDGKLNTMVKDRFGRNHYVLKEFVNHGASEEILYEAKPHIGTDILKNVVKNIREEILSLGGEVHFRTKLTGIISDSEGNLSGIRLLNDKGETMERGAKQVILAIGHSSRDTFTMLYEKKILMRQKAFAIGVRVEHPAAMIDQSQYGPVWAGKLPAASYKLTHQCKNGRGIYSFCMCPGGYVVNSSSEKGRLCVNGMSNYDRGSANSNTAIITTVGPEDFADEHPLAGMRFQRKYEELAYQTGGSSGAIPVQLYGDFRDDRKSSGYGDFAPCIKGQIQYTNLRKCLPDYIVESMLEGMEAFGRKIQGYNREDTILVGVETRTSSPVRIERDEYCQSNLRGLYPCGEGAGYAGGITSAAMDGLKVAEALAGKLCEGSRSGKTM